METRFSHIPGVFMNDALSLEYKLSYRKAMRQAHLSDFIGNAALKRFLSTHISHLEKEIVDRRPV